MSPVHAIVWLDHREARIVGFPVGPSPAVEIHSHSPQRQLPRTPAETGSGDADHDHRFFDQIAEALTDVREVLITGSGTAKTAFERYVQDRHPDVARRIAGVETLDHPSEDELAAYGSRYFTRVDQLGIG